MAASLAFGFRVHSSFVFGISELPSTHELKKFRDENKENFTAEMSAAENSSTTGVTACYVCSFENIFLLHYKTINYVLED